MSTYYRAGRAPIPRVSLRNRRNSLSSCFPLFPFFTAQCVNVTDMFWNRLHVNEPPNSSPPAFEMEARFQTDKLAGKHRVPRGSPEVPLQLSPRPVLSSRYLLTALGNSSGDLTRSLSFLTACLVFHGAAERIAGGNSASGYWSRGRPRASCLREVRLISTVSSAQCCFRLDNMKGFYLA